MNEQPSGLYWIGPLLESFTIAAVVLVTITIVVSWATGRTIRELVEDVLDHLTR